MEPVLSSSTMKLFLVGKEDELPAPAKKFKKKKRKKNFYKGDPPKKWELLKKFFFAFVNFENIHFVEIS